MRAHEYIGLLNETKKISPKWMRNWKGRSKDKTISLALIHWMQYAFSFCLFHNFPVQSAVCFIVPMQIGFFSFERYSSTKRFFVLFHSFDRLFVRSFVHFNPHTHVCVFSFVYYLFVHLGLTWIQYFSGLFLSTLHSFVCVLCVLCANVEKNQSISQKSNPIKDAGHFWSLCFVLWYNLCRWFHFLSFCDKCEW